MSEFQLKELRVEAGGKTVVDGVSLVLKAGEINVLMGPNGSGKSSLLNAIMGHPKYKITEGGVLLDGQDMTALPTEKKAQAGIFLSLQHLPEIAGVTLTNFLHKAYIAEKGTGITPLDFYKMMEARAKEFGIDANFLKKHVNAGLSGGEKKQSEVLQLLALEPKFALLDEIDSGVDVDAQKRVFAVIEHLRAKGVGFLLISHHPNLLEHVKPDYVHVMRGGKVVISGGDELIARITKEGFEKM
jgi:Fe-S cluster assembly ATP-binding protein